MLNKMWWENEKGELHRSIFDTVATLEERQQERFKAILAFYQLYGNADYVGLSRNQYNRTASKHRLKFNLVRSLCDTAQSLVARERILPMILTDGGSYDQRKLGEKASDFVYGAFTRSNFFSNAETIALNTTIFGNGWGKHVIRNNTIETENVFPSEIILDDAEVMNSYPTVLYQKKAVSKYHLKKMFPEKAGLIDMANRSSVENSWRPNFLYWNKAVEAYTKGSVYDFVDVVEAWHLPSGEDENDGRHAIVCANVTLLDEGYAEQSFPFSLMRYRKPPLGYLGIGIAENSLGLQCEINEILQKIQHITYMLTPKILKSSQTVISQQHLNNDVMAILEWSGALPPEMIQVGMIPPELLTMLAWAIERGYEQEGISMMTSQAEKPIGLNSRPALLTMHNIESQRHIIFGREYSDFHVDAARKYVRMAKEIKNYKVLVPKSTMSKQLNYSDISALDLDNCIFQTYPKNLLSKEPAGRLEQVDMLLNMGVIGQDDGRRLLDFPDIKATQTLYDAKINTIDTIVETMLETKEFIAPDPMLDLTYGIQRMNMVYQQGLVEKLGEERLDLVRNWIFMAQNMVGQAQAQAQQEQMAQMQQQQMIEQGAPSNVVPMVG